MKTQSETTTDYKSCSIKIHRYGVTTRKCAKCPVRETPITFRGSRIRVACDVQGVRIRVVVARSAIGRIKRSLFTLK